MAATSDESMESLLSNFDHIYQELKDNITEVESLKSICNGEIKRRESLEFTCNSLKTDNERLMKAYTESFNKMADQIEGRSKCVNLKEELKKLTEERAIKEEGHRKALELLKQEDEKKIGELERQVRCALVQQTANEAMVNQLNQDLAEHKAHIEFLNTRLERVHADVKSKYHMELEDLKDWLLVEQEEKRELIKKLQSAEKELLMFRKKLEEQQRDSTSNRHFETLKQKIMELRNKNEVLKRQLNSEDSKFLSWLTRRRHPKTIATTKMRLTKWWKNMFLRRWTAMKLLEKDGNILTDDGFGLSMREKRRTLLTQIEHLFILSKYPKNHTRMLLKCNKL